MNNNKFGFMPHFYKSHFNLKEEKQRDFNLMDFDYEKAKESLRLASILTFFFEITIYSMFTFLPLINKTIHFYHFILFNLFFIISIFIFISTFPFQRRFFIIYCYYCLLCILISSVALISLHHIKLNIYFQNQNFIILSTLLVLLIICLYYYISHKNNVIEELEKNLYTINNLNDNQVKYFENLKDMFFFTLLLRRQNNIS